MKRHQYHHPNLERCNYDKGAPKFQLWNTILLTKTHHWRTSVIVIVLFRKYEIALYFEMRSNTKICINHGILWYATIMHTILLKCIMHLSFRRVLKVNAVKLSAFNLASIYKRPKLQNIKTLYMYIVKVLLYFIYLSHSTKREINRYCNYNMILSVLLHEKYMKKKIHRCSKLWSGVLKLTCSWADKLLHTAYESRYMHIYLDDNFK